MGIIVGIAFLSLAGYIVRLAMRPSTGNGRTERERPLRHHPPAGKPRKTA